MARFNFRGAWGVDRSETDSPVTYCAWPRRMNRCLLIAQPWLTSSWRILLAA